MRTTIAAAFSRLARWLHTKQVPPGLAGSQWTGTGFVDAFKRNRNPTPNEMLSELKNTAFTCASINAAVCAAFAPRLYVATSKSQPEPKCMTKSLNRQTSERLKGSSLLTPMQKAGKLEEVLTHPLLTLLRN